MGSWQKYELRHSFTLSKIIYVKLTLPFILTAVMG